MPLFPSAAAVNGFRELDGLGMGGRCGKRMGPEAGAPVSWLGVGLFKVRQKRKALPIRPRSNWRSVFELEIFRRKVGAIIPTARFGNGYCEKSGMTRVVGCKTASAVPGLGSTIPKVRHAVGDMRIDTPSRQPGGSSGSATDYKTARRPHTGGIQVATGLRNHPGFELARFLGGDYQAPKQTQRTQRNGGLDRR